MIFLKGDLKPPKIHRVRKNALVSLVQVVCVALIDSTSRILVSQRAETGTLPGKWEYPGGKVETGETLEAALVRELHEELGISTEASCLAPVTFSTSVLGDDQLVLFLYACRVWHGTPQAQVAQRLKWCEYKELRELDMPKADIPLTAALRDYL